MILMEKWRVITMSKWAEIRNDYYDDTEHKVCIDAWETEYY